MATKKDLLRDVILRMKKNASEPPWVEKTGETLGSLLSMRDKKRTKKYQKMLDTIKRGKEFDKDYSSKDFSDKILEDVSDMYELPREILENRRQRAKDKKKYLQEVAREVEAKKNAAEAVHP